MSEIFLYLDVKQKKNALTITMKTFHSIKTELQLILFLCPEVMNYNENTTLIKLFLIKLS